jgi:predicted nucleic acid-binding protein
VTVQWAYGVLRVGLEAAGLVLPDADLKIGATGATEVYHGLELVTGNIRHSVGSTG